MLTLDQLSKLGDIYTFVKNTPLAGSHSEIGMRDVYIGKQADAMAHLAIIMSQALSASMQLLFLDCIRETFESDGGVSYRPHLKTIIEMQTDLLKDLPDVPQNYHHRSCGVLFNN
jgi:hypothetical protein